MPRHHTSLWLAGLVAMAVGPLACSGTGSGTPGPGASSSSGGSGSGAGSSGGSGSNGSSGNGSSGTGGSSGSSGSSGASGSSSGAAGSGSSGGSSGGGSDAGGSSGAHPDASTGGSSSGSGDAGSGGSGGPDGAIEAGPNAVSTATRPQLTDMQAAGDTILNYLAQAGTLGSLVTDNWNPTGGLGDPTAWTPTFTVAADGSGTHMTVQAALSAATGTSRAYILVKPGTYTEPVCVAANSAPITLYGTSADPSLVTIVFHNQGNAGGIAKPNPCVSGTATGTFATATLMAFANDFQVKNITISNDFASPSGTYQAVALMTQADKQVYENIHLHGFQDTFFVNTPSVTTVSRVYVKNSFIEGDTDFIFGRATAVMDTCTINYLSSRRAGGAGGALLAPSTVTSNNYGLLVVGSNLTAQSGTPAGVAYLGRAWDNTGTPANGQALVRESYIGAHIRLVDPWAAAATSGRAFSATGNRLLEYRNSGPGAAH